MAKQKVDVAMMITLTRRVAVALSMDAMARVRLLARVKTAQLEPAHVLNVPSALQAAILWGSNTAIATT